MNDKIIEKQLDGALDDLVKIVLTRKEKWNDLKENMHERRSIKEDITELGKRETGLKIQIQNLRKRMGKPKIFSREEWRKEMYERAQKFKENRA